MVYFAYLFRFEYSNTIDMKNVRIVRLFFIFISKFPNGSRGKPDNQSPSIKQSKRGEKNQEIEGKIVRPIRKKIHS